MIGEALHPEELALLRAVCAEPDDDTPRLVLADWYQETGQQVLVAFGEFIRQHVADTRVPTIVTKSGTHLDIASGKMSVVYREVDAMPERAKAHLLGIFPIPADRDDAKDNAGNLWAARLFGLASTSVSGYAKPSMWDRGFPAVVSFGSVIHWERDRKVYERVPVVRTKVKGRQPYPSSLTGQYSAVWRRGSVHFGKMHQSNLPPEVFDRLLNKAENNGTAPRSRYRNYNEAFADAELAFTDAGRFLCGIPRRHLKPKKDEAVKQP
jgi:uncharacterized protein (TIGR02996 family)